MISELEVFNAQVTLAIAHAARFPGKTDVLLAGQARQLTRLQRHSVAMPGEHEAFKEMFGRRRRVGMLSLYFRFYELFGFEPEFATKRLVVNAPPGIKFPKTSYGKQVELNFDSRFGPVTSVTEMLAFNTFEGGQVDDITFYSEDGLGPEDAARLAHMVSTGGTFTFVKPHESCDWWFNPCGVTHNFQTYLGGVQGKIEHIYTSHPADPLAVTVLGVNLAGE